MGLVDSNGDPLEVGDWVLRGGEWPGVVVAAFAPSEPTGPWRVMVRCGAALTIEAAADSFTKGGEAIGRAEDRKLLRAAIEQRLALLEPLVETNHAAAEEMEKLFDDLDALKRGGE